LETKSAKLGNKLKNLLPSDGKIMFNERLKLIKKAIFDSLPNGYCYRPFFRGGNQNCPADYPFKSSGYCY